MKLGSSRGMDTKRPRRSERSKPCHELSLTRPSQPPYPWPPEQAQSGVSKPYRTTIRGLDDAEAQPVPSGFRIRPRIPMRSTRRSDPSSAARPREPMRPASPVAPRSERKRCRRPQTASAPCGRPRQTRHTSDGSCRRPAKEPAPLARSSGHRRATPAHWLAEPTDASPTHRAPARSVQNVHLPTRSQGESSPQTNPTQPAWQELFAFPMSRGIDYFALSKEAKALKIS